MKQIKVYFESGRSTEWLTIGGMDNGGDASDVLTLYHEPLPPLPYENEGNSQRVPFAVFEKYAGYVLREVLEIQYNLSNENGIVMLSDIESSLDSRSVPYYTVKHPEL
jgi:hypothetical protein